MKLILQIVFAGVLLSGTSVLGQNELYVTLRGTSYQTNALGGMVPHLITQHTLKADEAHRLGVTPLRSLALVYHVNGSSFGDTIDLVNVTNGAVVSTVFGFFFGDDPSLNRVAITNSAGTIVKRIDYIYTRQNSHSMGAALTTKRYVHRGQYSAFPIITSRMQWVVAPEGTNSTQICVASFTTTRPFKPHPLPRGGPP
jgi:hypothetical protein